jgi:RND family efflux transporter MFP subunit
MPDTFPTKSNRYLSSARLFNRAICFVCLAAVGTVSGEVAAPRAPSSSVSRGSMRGTLRPERDLSQPARASGFIEKFGAEEGQPVKKGDLLVQLNADKERAEVERARALVEIAASEVARTTADLKTADELLNDPLKIGSKQKVQDAQFAHALALGRKREADANLTIASDRLNERATLAAISGTVVRRWRGVGEFVEQGEQIARVIDVSKLYVEFYLGPELRDKFTRGQTAKILIEEGSAQGTTIPAQVVSIDPFMLPETSTFRIRLEVEPSEKVQVGMPVILQLPSEVH